MPDPIMPTTTAPSEGKPENGLKGLRHWRHDLRSGLMVAMISLPFSMGIAITSGAPPVCGVVSAIIAGLLLPFLGGSYVTISGPAAGLAPVIFAGMVALGAAAIGGDATTEEKLKTGYPLILVAICLAGILQMMLAKLRVARLSAIFPSAAIHGMLAAIGLMILVKQIPFFLGQKFEAHEFWEILQETPRRIPTMSLPVFWLGIGSTATLFILAALPLRFLRMLPPPVWVFLGGTIVAQVFLHLNPTQMITIPEAPLANGIVLPDFTPYLTNHALWAPLTWIVATLMLVDGAESLATIAAVDRIDPWRRKSDPDRTLLAMGASNVCSSVLGGLTIIPGIVKSTANILGGGRTQWANFFNACFLMIFLTAGRNLINMVPKCILASILLFIGFKLCRPQVWVKTARIGWEQLAIFATTVLVTVSTDLLIGITVGTAVKYILSLWTHLLAVAIGSPAGKERRNEKRAAFTMAAALFRNPVAKREYVNGIYRLSCNRPLVCFNLFHLLRELDGVPPGAQTVQLHLLRGVSLIDHTTYENLFHYLEEHNSKDGRPFLEINGLDRMRPLWGHELSIRLACE
jgi:carbonic anhydrase